MKSSRGALPIILLAIFIDMVSNGILVPIVPQLLANPNSSLYILPLGFPISEAYIILGLLIGIFPLFCFFATPIFGEYSDYVGRRKVMALALFGTTVALSIFATGVIMKSLTLLFIGRILGGIMGGNISVAQAAMADITPPQKRASMFGLIGAAYGFGFIVGPVIGALLSDSSLVTWFSASTPFWFAALLSLINGILVFFYLNEGARSKEQGEGYRVKGIENHNRTVSASPSTLNPIPYTESINWHKAVSNIFRAFGMKKMRIVFLTNFIFQAGLTLFATFFAVFLIHNFGFNQVNVGYYIAYAGIWAIISQGIMVPLLSKHFDEVILLRVFLIAGSASVFLYYITEHTIGLLVVGACFALTNGVAMSLLPSLASRRASSYHQGGILGINGSVQSLAQAVPPILAGFLAAEITPSAPVYIAGAVIGIAWVVFIVGVRREG